ncbi:MAG: ACP S-malonyltransferase [Syntrophomonas sp.]|uniref:ACP S-malonyltransferase n=1 Tax=Syntrophomonas sp. TaxID=2053627 RepID=UPI0026293DF5|nr:ACP S-malonyltransferase [Syntrophomonas sp.]MDD2509827.1 ACP S-malonyltransferase [Syntrophomonas sp.]MDD3878747.1 ACP S-malonyltransferase [Syntrophomonas sp.]MDD4625613.1 ACP S-malonyltransferase [Syntrophomonas sp.]
MPRIAFVFPGQGAQYPGMGKELAEKYEEAAQVFATADRISPYSISSLCFEGSPEQLNQTEFAQPALLVSSMAALVVAKKSGICAEVLAGLSLGEYTALVAAGALNLEEALPLVQKRAILMQEAVPPGQGAMAAVLGMDALSLENICSKAVGQVGIANYNCPGQLVISGEMEAVRAVTASIKETGGRVIPLAVSVPSHSPLMYEAAMKLKAELAQVKWQQPLIPVVSNVNAQENGPEEFEELLTQQLFKPVLWEQSVRYMMNKADYFIEIGPGSTLSGLIKKIDRNRVLGQVEDSKSLEKLLKKVESI